MNLATKLKQRAAEGRPVRVGLIGAGKFGSMFLAQLRTTTGLHLLGVADLSAERARQAMVNTGWDVDAALASSFDDARKTGRTHVTEDAEALIRADGLDVVVDATGSPAAGIRHALLSAENGRHIVMVNVEADVLAGAYLAEQFRRGGAGLQPGLWRPAGAGLRDGRLGRDLRLPGGGRRQGHQVPAGLSPVHARHGLGPFRHHRRGGAGRRHEPADVQLLHRRHQIGDRDGGDLERHGPRGAARRPAVPAGGGA